MKRALVSISAALLLAGAPAAAVTLSFEDLSVGSILSSQYTSLGVSFSANAFSGSGSPGGNWASNTDMSIVDSAGDDVGALGDPAGTVSGHVLRSFGGWLDENGDPSFSMHFSTPIASISVAFAGVDEPANTQLFAYDGATLIGSTAGSGSGGQFTLVFSAPQITRVDVTPGWFLDWVAVDNVSFAPIPEGTTLAMLVVGLGVLTLKRRGQR